jgi:hypothetical protein
METNETDIYLIQVENELMKAKETYPDFHSMHEGYAVLLEEVEELWNEVKRKPKDRNDRAIKKECIQIAAMALRVIIDGETNGWK